VEDRGHERPDPGPQEHVAQLRHRRVRQHLLDVGLGRPIVPAKTAVAQPTIATTSIATGACQYSDAIRDSMYTPAVTIVAAWISAETGVGPAIASGSQT